MSLCIVCHQLSECGTCCSDECYREYDYIEGLKTLPRYVPESLACSNTLKLAQRPLQILFSDLYPGEHFRFMHNKQPSCRIYCKLGGKCCVNTEELDADVLGGYSDFSNWEVERVTY